MNSFLKISGLILLVLVASIITAAYVPQQAEPIEYLSAQIVPPQMGKGFVIIIDDGQDAPKAMQSKMVLDENGKPKKFVSRVEALNHLGQQGWQLVQTIKEKQGLGEFTTFFFLRSL